MHRRLYLGKSRPSLHQSLKEFAVHNHQKPPIFLRNEGWLWIAGKEGSNLSEGANKLCSRHDLVDPKHVKSS